MSLVLALVVLYLAYVPGQSDFGSLLAGYSIAFILYALLLGDLLIKGGSERIHVITGIGIRLGLIFAFPALSDDIFRFIWDGQLIHSGINPLSHTPEQIMLSHDLPAWEDLYNLLNSPSYFTVYPPLSQLVFYIACFFPIEELFASSIVIKSFLFVSDLGVLYLLRYFLARFDQPRSKAMIYFLNPLILLELVGNAHFEGMYIFLFLAAVYFLDKSRIRVSAMIYSLSIACKLLPLMFLPILVKYFKELRSCLRYYLLVGLMSLILFSSFLYRLDFDHFLQSLNLYFQKFEFNASVYYLLRYLGQLLTGYNQIWILGPVMGIGALVFMLRKLKRSDLEGERELLELSFYFFMVYLISTTTVHPWYLSLPIALSVFKPRLYVLVWSFTVIFSYSLYAESSFISHYAWVFLEYSIVVLVYILERRTGNLWVQKKPLSN